MIATTTSMIPMSDGTKLAAEIYFPGEDGVSPAAGRYPVLLLRTPYDWKGMTRPRGDAPPPTPATWIRPDLATDHGYVAVYQDARGAFESEGTFEPMLNEGQDGVDTVEWLRKQPWSNGKVATFGPSYMGGVQMLLAAEQAEGHVAAVSQVAATDQFKNEWVYMDGVLTSTASTWTMLIADDTARRLPEDKRAALRADYAALGISNATELTPELIAKVTSSLPVKDMPVVRHAPWWSAWVANRDNPRHFEPNRMGNRFAKIALPILHLGGWYDLFLRNTIAHYKGISTQAADPTVRTNQRLIIGPWSHSTSVGCDRNADVDGEAMQLAWMDQWMKGKKHPFFDHRVTIYVMGENRWRAEETWPLQGTQRTKYYLHSDGGANTAEGDGTLSTAAPGVEQPDSYRYDPRQPVPSLGGPALFGGRAAQNDIEARRDVLVYTSPVLDEDVEVSGEITATLYAASSATDTDWWMKLVDVAPDGRAEILTQGVVRARYRNSRENPEPLTPGKIEKYELDLWATSNVFKKGHRIRIDLASSNFPHGDRNPNAFVDLSSATEKDFEIATQTIHHDQTHPSSIDLPVIPASRERNWIETPFLTSKPVVDLF